MAIIGLGASMGPRERTLRLAVQALAAHPDIQVLAASRIWTSTPVGGVSRRPFLNAAVRLQTALSPHALLRCCQALETRLGRRPAQRWADRALDLDILLYGAQVMQEGEGGLVLPHPGLLLRSFALVPAQEVGGDLWHPLQGQRLGDIALPPAGGGGLWPVGVLARRGCTQ